MAIRYRNSKIEISGRTSFRDLYNWARSNPSHAKAINEDTVELLKKTIIKNYGSLDSSYSTLILNHRLEDERNRTSSSGKWICKKGVVHLKGIESMYSEYWAIPEWDDVHVIINKAGGRVSFFRSERCSSRVLGEVRNVKYFIKQGEVDAHLQLCGGVGILKDTNIESEDSRMGFLLVRDTDTDGVVIKGLNLGGWTNLSQRTTMHKNMVMDHGTSGDKDKIPFLYRRNNNCVFYNVINETTQERKKFVDYRNPQAWSGNGRSVIVGKFSPELIDVDGNPLKDVNVSIRRLSDSEIEHQKKTNDKGVVEIRVNNSKDEYTSLEWQGRRFYEAGTCYIKQSITPNKTGPQISLDQGEFRVRLRKPELMAYETTRDFHEDLEGQIVLFKDEDYSNSFSSYYSGRRVDTAQQLYDHYKQHICEFDNIDQAPCIEIVGNYIISDYSITVDPTLSNGISIDNNKKLIKVKASNIKANFYSREGMVRLMNGAIVDGTIEDINGCRVRIFAKQGGRFNIYAKRADSGLELAHYSNVESCDVYVPRGTDIKFAMWQLGYQVYADRIKTDNGGINYHAPMIKNKYIDTRIDVRDIVNNVRLSMTYPVFTMYFDKAMSLDIEEIKTLLHYIVGSKESLSTSTDTGSVSTIEIMKDEIKINLPFIRVMRGAGLDKTDRVELNGFLNTTNADKINPNYVINPSDENGLYVQKLNVKPTLDPLILAHAVKGKMDPELASLLLRLVSAVKE